MPLEEVVLPIHAKHFKDGYPLCWDEGQMGLFEGSWDDSLVTCKDCLYYLTMED